jgi:hypothetical protein
MKKERTMNKLVRLIQTYLLIGLPFVLACMARKSITPSEMMLQETFRFTNILWEILSFNLMLWFTVLIIFLAMLVAVPSVREKTLRRLANLKERDEREEYITGKASRAAYISTLSLMIFFLFFSIFSFSYYRVPENQAIHGKRNTISVNAEFNLLGDSQIIYSPGTEMVFTTKNLSLSPASILFILIGWQLLAFNLAARKEQD